MSAPRIDLYSDTNTKPTPPMRHAMAEAEVGDEQAFEDPTVNKLCAMVAELLGQEAAVFLPSGTMCNQIAFRVHCQPGDEIILDYTAHPINAESGGPSALANAQTRALHTELGIFTADQVRAAIRPVRRHVPRSRVVSIENTTNAGGGSVWPIEDIAAVTAVARENDMAAHMDGARLMNAVVESGTPAKEYGKHFDSLWLDLSKGLGCPIGGVLAGSADFIEQAWRFKQQMGGAMRQAGIVAAAGVYALENNVARLAEDHENARSFSRDIAQIPGIKLIFDRCETNLVFFDVSETGLDAATVEQRLKARDVRIGAMGPYRMRAVTHLDIDAEQLSEAASVLREVVA
ncbi:MAG: threonine aldolase family protein [Rhodospirillaceae bacterium]|jgi:threonine aldolase|nr:threonine aldolase family protein [Rhodospirillaceae bacterium]MBT5192114.1 threonine aldolase family protein [Rhodospirillaceae bacterium]MBT5896329.1 threonine aldolase family protein [Rhodospirillaceae bacterium]MBT6426251.1 threonine aldolase family protein [Rhodospirillaceae bacterium]